MRSFLFIVSMLTACGRDNKSEGLPPAQAWSGGSAPGSSALPDVPGSTMPANPHGGPAMPANPHGGGMPANPHAGGGISGDPHVTGDPAVPTTQPARTLAKRPDGRLTLGPFSLALPKDWAEKPITSSMRAAHFTVGDAELIVYYFGQEGAGSDQDNIDRWLDQMVQPDGKPTKGIAKIEQAKFAGQDATTISATGKYAGMAMGGAAPTEVADAMMLAAIVKSPAGPYYFKFTGPKATVQANATKFRALLTSLKVER